MKIPTRFWIIIMVFFTAFINYTARVSFSISIISMVKPRGKQIIPECNRDSKEKNITNKTDEGVPDFGPRYDWDESIQGHLLGSYFYGYVISSFPGGLVAEWIGPFYTIFWSSFIILIMNTISIYVAAWHWTAFFVTRFVMGLLAGFSYPALQCLVAQWAPPHEKGKFSGAMLGNTCGTFITWMMVGFIIEKTEWKWGFYFVSAEIALFCLAFWILVADTPAKHKWISDEERDYIETSMGGNVNLQKRIPPYKKMFSSIHIWALACSHWGDDWGLYVQITGVPKYLAEVLGFSLSSSGFLGALPHLSRFIFGMISGTIVDIILKRNLMSKTATRKLFTVFSHVLPGLLLLIIPLLKCGNLSIIVAILITNMALNGAAAVTVMVNPQDLAPNFAGTVYGFNNLLGGCTGFLATEVTAALIEDNNGMKEWGWVFIIGGIIFITTATIYFIFGSAELEPWNNE